MTDEDLKAMLAEFVNDCHNLLEHAKEAQAHFAEGDLEAVKQVVGVSHYKIGQANADREGILKHLGA